MFWFCGIAEAEVWVEAVVGAGAEDRGEDEVGEGFWLEEELDECACVAGLFDERRFWEL